MGFFLFCFLFCFVFSCRYFCGILRFILAQQRDDQVLFCVSNLDLETAAFASALYFPYCLFLTCTSIHMLGKERLHSIIFCSHSGVDFLLDCISRNIYLLEQLFVASPSTPLFYLIKLHKFTCKWIFLFLCVEATQRSDML